MEVTSGAAILYGYAKLVDLAMSFPSLATRKIEGPEELEAIATDPGNGTGVRCAARFCLYVWTQNKHHGWDLADSWKRWDDKHRAAWQAWAAAPWWG